MTRKDFCFIAGVLNQQLQRARQAVDSNDNNPNARIGWQCRESAISDMIGAFERELAKTNARFDASKFVVACLKTK